MMKDNPGEYFPLQRKEGDEIGRGIGGFNGICNVLFLPENLKQIWHNVKV